MSEETTVDDERQVSSTADVESQPATSADGTPTAQVDVVPDKVDEPILLIHGEADNNSGTYPMQSERFYNALKGLGATTRLVMLPCESHSYRARESILHLLWETQEWLRTYVKNGRSDGEAPGGGVSAGAVIGDGD